LPALGEYDGRKGALDGDYERDHSVGCW
jgi:hypothetical protein